MHSCAFRADGGRQGNDAAAATDIQYTISSMNLHRGQQLPRPRIDLAVGKNAWPGAEVDQPAAIAEGEVAREFPPPRQRAGFCAE